MQHDFDKSKIDHRIHLLKKIIHADEDEKLLISLELHENIAQMLAAVRLHISLAKNNVIGEGLAFIDEAESLLKEALSGVRTIATSISPIALKTLGIGNSIDDLLLILKEQKDIKCTVIIDEKIIEATSVNVQNILFQVVQLQVINILKNSNAKKVSISIKPKKGRIQLIINDNGNGVLASTIHFGEGFLAIQERVEAFDGIFEVTTEEGKPGYKLEVII